MRAITNLVRNDEELSLIRKSGEIAAKALKKILGNTHSGVLLSDLDSIGEKEILKEGGYPSFKTVPGYDFTTCLAVNEQVVHAIPRKIPLKTGDILSVDIGAIYKGWYSDLAWSVIVDEQDYSGEDKKAKQKFLRAGKDAMWNGVKQAFVGNHIGDIGNAMQKVVEGSGYNVVKSLVGHGVGRSYHEEPEVPGFGKPGTGMMLLKNMTIAVESIYTSGSGDIYQEEDGWTIVTADGSWGGMFEMTVIVKEKPEIITDWRKV